MTKRIAIVHGCYFHNNFGDIYLIKALCDKICEDFGRENVYLANCPEKKIANSIGYSNVPIAYLFKYDVELFYSGGGYFGEPNCSHIKKLYWGLTNSYRHYFRNIVHIYLSNKFSIIAIGAGPITSKIYRLSVKLLLNKSSFVSARDEVSRDFLQSLIPTKKIMLTRDFCFDFPNTKLFKDVINCSQLNLNKKSENLKIGFHLTKLPLELQSSIFKFFEEQYPDADIYNIVDNTSKHIPTKNNQIVFEGDILQFLVNLSTLDIVVTSKLHVGLFSILLGLKVISIPYHQKTIRYYTQLNLEKYCLNDYTKYSNIQVNGFLQASITSYNKKF